MEFAVRHPIFDRFQGFTGTVPADCEVDFIGAFRHRDYAEGDPPPFDRTESIESQGLDNEYFEWIDILESVNACRDRYTMIEVGAGYGRWACRAALAAKQRGIPEIRIGAIEGEPAHARWIREHFDRNGISEGESRIYACAVGAESGTAMFAISEEGEASQVNPRYWYGQRMLDGRLGRFEPVPDDTYFGSEIFRRRNGARMIKVPVRPLPQILEDFDRVDLMDFDIQGEELAVIASSIDLIDTQVALIHIGTHGLAVESGLREVFLSHGWECRRDFSLNSVVDTAYGRVSFDDGVQSWRNPRLQ